MKLRFTNQKVCVYNENKVTVVTYHCELWNNNLVVRRFKVTGEARLADGDTPDANMARHIADSRAKEKAYTVALNGTNARELKLQKAQLLRTLDTIKFLEKLVHLKNAERKHIKSILK